MVQHKASDPRRFALINVRMHRSAWDKIGHMSDVLKERAEQGLHIPLRLDLGRTHLVDAIVDLAMKEWKIDG